ncbi:unnamed protein product [Staurois parvus]|uniref:C2H2-type domain-containing protein n=1 Tax=Staurois parvus TaxID=386267 RepID=A0ABN9BJ74_9NEOB|nr:unnamed protein product [Staurois parvus]
MCPRCRLTIHKKHRFLRMHTWHPAVMPTHTTEAGKTASRWIEATEGPAELSAGPVF